MTYAFKSSKPRFAYMLQYVCVRSDYEVMNLDRELVKYSLCLILTQYECYLYAYAYI